jgi:hypothetical protein
MIAKVTALEARKDTPYELSVLPGALTLRRFRRELRARQPEAGKRARW